MHLAAGRVLVGHARDREVPRPRARRLELRSQPLRLGIVRTAHGAECEMLVFELRLRNIIA